MASTNVGSIHIDMNLDINPIKQSFLDINRKIKGLEMNFNRFSSSILKGFSKKQFMPVFSSFDRFYYAIKPIPSALLDVQEGLLLARLEIPIFAAAINKTSKSQTLLSRNMHLIASSINAINIALPRTAVFLKAINFYPMYSNWDNALNNMESRWNNMWGSILLGLSRSLNSVVSQFNYLIAGLNRIQINIPAIVPGKAANFGFSIPNIPTVPALATGGIVNSPTLALIGERGKEAVLPLQNNTEWMQKLADIINKNSQSNPNSNSKVNLYLDSRKIAEGIIDDFVDIAKRRDIRI